MMEASVKLIPNLLTLARLALAPYLFVLLLRRDYALTLALFFAAGISDALDGFAARRFGGASRFGAYLDPMADKILLSGILVTVGIDRVIEFWIVAVVLGRDVLILAFAAGLMLHTRQWRSFPPSGWGKLSTLSQILLVIAILMHLAIGFPPASWLTGFKTCTVALAFLSAFDYYLRAFRSTAISNLVKMKA